MPRTLKVAAISLDIAWADPQENLSVVESIIEKLPSGIDVVVLPELFSTGFIIDPQVMNNVIEPNTGHTMSTIKNYAKRFNVAICGSFIAGNGYDCYNRGFFVEPSGEETFYDKAHLFSLSDESKIFKPGSQKYPVVRFRGWNIAFTVCYDLRFPVWCRNGCPSYDLMIIPSNWPESRRYAWEHLLIARAIENQAYYIGVDRSGTDDFGSYGNMTMAADAMGTPIVSRANVHTMNDTKVEVFEVNKDSLEECRRKLPFQPDGDSFCINNKP